MTLDIAMMHDETGQEDRHPVYLPENRHHWASNDEVGKPAVDLLRGPIRARFRKKKTRAARQPPGVWMRANLPKIAASAIVGIVVLCVVLAFYLDVAAMF
jgi:anti-sigma-K factor RskA